MAKFQQALSDLYSYGAAIAPQKRTRFDKSHSVSTTFDSAWLIPVAWDRVVPGDEKQIRVSALARMATPLHPTMDEAFLYTWAFYIPDRLWWNHAKEFYGENKFASFNPDGEYIMPYLKPEQYMCFKGEANVENSVGSLNDYLGMPFCRGRLDQVNFNDFDSYITAGLHRSYQLVWNECFRNSSIQPALQLNDGDTVTDAEWNVISQLRRVNKLPDMFTSLLREPQAGEDVLLPIQEYVPVVTTSQTHSDSYKSLLLNGDFSGGDPDQFLPVYGMIKDSKHGYLSVPTTDGMALDDVDVGGVTVWPQNLWAHMTDPYLGSINQLRQAVVMQHLLEVDNTSGKRYNSLIAGHFSVFIPDPNVQRPEILGASRTRIGMRQTIQTSGSEPGTALTPQGNVAGLSVTNVDNEWICNKAFLEPGFIMIMAAVRPVHSYSQGVDPLLRKLSRFDHYYPAMDGLGNQPVYTSEIFADLTYYDGVDELGYINPFTDVFGYKEAWNEYKARKNSVTGLMRPDVDGTLASWNYSDYFETPPILESGFISEDEYLIDRTIAVQTEPQFIADFWFDYYDTKSMSKESVPGLLYL